MFTQTKDLFELAAGLLRRRMSARKVTQSGLESWRRQVFKDVRKLVEGNGFFLAYTTGRDNSTVKIDDAMQSDGLIISNWCGRVRCIVTWQEVDDDYLHQFRVLLVKLQLINANDPYKFSILASKAET